MDNKTALEALQQVIIAGRSMGYQGHDPNEIAALLDETEYLVGLIIRGELDTFSDHLYHMAKKFPKCAFLPIRYNLKEPKPSEHEIYLLRAKELGISFVDLIVFKPEQDALDSLPAQVAKRLSVIPLKRAGTLLFVATAQPQNMTITDELRLVSRCTIRAVMAPPSDIAEALEKYYPE